MTGYAGYPPGCTQWHVDHAQGADDEPPLQWYVCRDCGGDGHTVHRITVYEAGCGFPHDDSEERPCELCGGAGGHYDDAEADAPR